MSVTPVPPSGFPKQFQDTQMQSFAESLTSAMLSKLPDFSELRERDFPDTTQQQIFSSLERMGREGTALFPMPEEELLKSPEVFTFMAEGFSEIILSALKEVEHLPPNRTVECGVNEAVFTHALDKKPIAVTYALATCVGIAGFEGETQAGFVMHIATEVEFEASKEVLEEKIRSAFAEATSPIQLHLRGGIAGLSEKLVEAIEEWVTLLSETGCPMLIASKDVLTEGLLDAAGIPNAMSLSLDTTSGVLGEYDPSTNPYARKRQTISSSEELDRLSMELLAQRVVSCPEVKVVYFAGKPTTAW